MPFMLAEEYHKILLYYYIFVDNSDQETIIRYIRRNTLHAIGNKICQESAAASIIGIIIEILNYASIRTEVRV